MIKGKVDLTAQSILYPEATVGSCLQIISGHNGLDAQVILFVHHHGEAFFCVQHHSRRVRTQQQILADQVTLTQCLPLVGTHVTEAKQFKALIRAGELHGIGSAGNAGRSQVGMLCHIKGQIFIVSCKANPGGKNGCMIAHWACASLAAISRS